MPDENSNYYFWVSNIRKLIFIAATEQKNAGHRTKCETYELREMLLTRWRNFNLFRIKRRNVYVEWDFFFFVEIKWTWIAGFIGIPRKFQITRCIRLKFHKYGGF